MTKKTIVLLTICILALIVSGCTETDSSVLDEYNRYVETIEDDISELDAAAEDFDLLVSMAEADGEYSSDELEPLIASVKEEKEIIQRMALHSENFESFIDENEEDLKELGIDTFEDQNEIGELNLFLESSTEEYEELLVEYEGIRDQLEELE